MKLVSVNVGRPRDVEWRGEAVRTAIFKAPVMGRLAVKRLNVEGDQQADELLQRASQMAALPQGWRDHVRSRLWEADA